MRIGHRGQDRENTGSVGLLSMLGRQLWLVQEAEGRGRKEDLRAAGKGAVSVSGLLCLSEGSALCLEAQDFGWGP